MASSASASAAAAAVASPSLTSLEALVASPVVGMAKPPREIIAFNLSLTIGDALDVMSHYEIFSAPVVNGASQCVGHVDYLDLLCALVRLTGEADESAIEPLALAVRPADYDHLTRRANDWTLENAFVAQSLAEARPFFCVGPSTTLLETLRFMGAGLHHVLVVGDQDGAVSNLVSQTDVIRELASRLAVLGPAVAGLSLREAGMGTRPVWAVRNTDAALDAFMELGAQGVSGGAIVNTEGKLVGNLSRHDLKGTQGGTGFGALNQSIMHYQRKHRVALAQRLVTVTPNSTVAEVLTTMARERVHRVFVVEGGMLPRGLVTQTDMCRVLAERLSGQAFSKKQAKKLMKAHCRRRLVFPLLFPPHRDPQPPAE